MRTQGMAMRSKATLFTAAILSAAMLTGCHAASANGDKTAAGNGNGARSFLIDRSFRAKSAPIISMELWGPQPYLVTTWSKDCKTCESQLANLDTLAAQGKYKVMVVDIDPILKPGSPDAFTPFLAARKYNDLIAKQAKGANDVESWEREPGSIGLFVRNLNVWNMTGTADFQSPDIRKLLEEADQVLKDNPY